MPLLGNIAPPSGELCSLASISIPNVLGAVERSRGTGAARYLDWQMTLALARAVSRSTMAALHFEEGPRRS
jgi:hypothetical protein